MGLGLDWMDMLVYRCSRQWNGNVWSARATPARRCIMDLNSEFEGDVGNEEEKRRMHFFRPLK